MAPMNMYLMGLNLSLLPILILRALACCEQGDGACEQAGADQRGGIAGGDAHRPPRKLPHAAHQPQLRHPGPGHRHDWLQGGSQGGGGSVCAAGLPKLHHQVGPETRRPLPDVDTNATVLNNHETEKLML